jgi:toxin FitB
MVSPIEPKDLPARSRPSLRSGLSYLVYTNVVSAGAPSRIAPLEQSATLFLSAVTEADIEGDVAKTRREGATRKSADLSAWLNTALLYDDRVLEFDTPTARIVDAL